MTRLFHNGPILTLSQPGQVEALVTAGDKILFTGPLHEARRAAGSGVQETDLAGRTLIPAFFDCHSHFPRSGAYGFTEADLRPPPSGGVDSIEALLGRLSDQASRRPYSPWIVGMGYDNTELQEKRHPTRHDLDRVSMDKPVMVSHISGHLCSLNTAGLRALGIDNKTPDPAGAVFRRDPGGSPDGVLEEYITQVRRHLSKPTAEETLEIFRRAGREYAAQGIATSVIAGNSLSMVENIKRARRAGVFPQNVVAMFWHNPEEWARFPVPGVRSAMERELRIRMGCVKFVHDGSIQGYTGYLSQPYFIAPPGKPGYRGYPLRDRESLITAVTAMHREGFQIAIHGNGDAAIDDILAAFEAAQKAFPRPDARHRIEHCQMVREDQLDRIRDLGVTPSFFVSHTLFWGDRHFDTFMGPERAFRMSPLKSALDRGIRFTLHNDTPVTPIHPLQSLASAVNRQSRSGRVLGEAQRITPEQALRALTVDAAWQNFLEGGKGTLEPGKDADLAVLSDNPLTSNPATLREINVLATYVGGKAVYESAD